MDEQRRRLRMAFPAMRHIVGEPPEGLVLTRTGLTFDLSESATSDAESALRDVLREHLDSGGKPSWRECSAAVRSAGLKVSNDLITSVRRELLGQPN
jgi:hypothetical protein